MLDPQTYDAASRRYFLSRSFNGIGAMAFGSMMADELMAAEKVPVNPLAIRKPHHKRKAKHCIFVFMQGGVSQMDSFEHKPELNKLHGKPLPKISGLSGELEGRLRFKHVCVGSAFKFAKHGKCGHPFSELYPHLSKHADKMAFVRGIKTDNQNHGPSTLHVTTGSQFPGHASVGSWVSYGLGTPNQNMPAYVVIQDPRGAPVNGAAVWSNGYLPGAYQGTLLRPRGTPILNLKNSGGLDLAQQRREFDVLKFLNEEHKRKRGPSNELDARINAYELAFRMQTAAPQLMDISQESKKTRQLYGLDNGATSGFGRQCLLARRLVESGVRYTLLIHGVQITANSWDDHGDVKGRMIRHSREVDKPIAGLLTDLQQRGLLEETLVVWASEMGRTPFKNGGMTSRPGRDHNSLGLVMWMAGGDVKGGSTVGALDEFGLRGIGDPIHIQDVHATILDLLGLDDEQLRYLHAGRLRRLTDTGGNVLTDIIA